MFLSTSPLSYDVPMTMRWGDSVLVAVVERSTRRNHGRAGDAKRPEGPALPTTPVGSAKPFECPHAKSTNGRWATTEPARKGPRQADGLHPSEQELSSYRGGRFRALPACQFHDDCCGCASAMATTDRT